MPSREQGVYEPSDEVRVFDGAEDDDDEEGSRLPLLVVIALLVLAAFGGVVWLAYEHGVASGRSEPRMLVADSGAVKVMPTDSGGTETPYKGLKIYEQQAPGDEDADTQRPPAANANHAANTAAAPSTAPPSLRPPVETTAPNTSAGNPMQTAAAEPATHAPRPLAAAKPATTTPKVVSVETQAVPPADDEAPSVPATSPAHAQVHAQSAVQAGTPSAAPAIGAVHGTATGSYLLQVGSYKSQDEADGAWKSFKAKHSGVLAGFSPDVKRVDLGDKGIWYRLRVGTFADKSSADDLCSKLKADGGTCFLAR